MRRDGVVPIVRIKSGKLKVGGSIQPPATNIFDDLRPADGLRLTTSIDNAQSISSGIPTRLMHPIVLQVVTFSSICVVVQPRLGNAAGLRFRIRGFSSLIASSSKSNPEG
jgi:hypothetical protein